MLHISESVVQSLLATLGAAEKPFPYTEYLRSLNLFDGYYYGSKYLCFIERSVCKAGPPDKRVEVALRLSPEYEFQFVPDQLRVRDTLGFVMADEDGTLLSDF